MHYAEHQKASQLEALMGNSQTEETLFRHYRAVQTFSGKSITRKIPLEKIQDDERTKKPS